jgi:DNA-binding NtrC family response regulator
MSDSILLIHDDPAVLRAMGARFEENGREVIRELSVETGVTTLGRLAPDAVLLSVSLASDEALVRLVASDVPVVLFGDAPAPEVLARALAAGALMVVDSRAGPDVLVRSARVAAAGSHARRLLGALLSATSPPHGVDSLGSSPAMRQIAQQIGLLAQSDRTTLLITGEAGVGKAWAARVIHDLGPRARKPFLSVRCSGAGATHLESLLFGHEQGVHVEATERRRGMLEIAEGGTLLLREVGDLPAEIQPKLLRVLETRTFRRVGGGADIGVDTRVMVTTRRNLSDDVDAGRLREDLFYRLSVMPLALPPLRDRSQEDRLGLITLLHQDRRADRSDGPEAISPEALDRLLAYSWPGNVSELANVLERALLLGRGQVAINVEHLPGEFRARAGLGDRRHTPMTLDSLEHQHIDRTLRYHGGNRTRAAKELGISRATLINKIKLYGITD